MTRTGAQRDDLQASRSSRDPSVMDENSVSQTQQRAAMNRRQQTKLGTYVRTLLNGLMNRNPSRSTEV